MTELLGQGQDRRPPHCGSGTTPGGYPARDPAPPTWTSALRAVGLARESEEEALAATLAAHRLRSLGSVDRLVDAGGGFVLLHRAAVWDPAAPPAAAVEVWSPRSPEAALAEALGRYLATNPVPTAAKPRPPSAAERLLAARRRRAEAAQRDRPAASDVGIEPAV